MFPYAVDKEIIVIERSRASSAYKRLLYIIKTEYKSHNPDYYHLSDTFGMEREVNLE